MLRLLQEPKIDAYRAEIEKLFAKHPDHDLFGSLPGAGPRSLPGSWVKSVLTAHAMKIRLAFQCVAGTAPVSYQSGQIHKVYLRRHCNKTLRHAVHLWANLSRQSCAWAAVYYDQRCVNGEKATPVLYVALASAG